MRFHGRDVNHEVNGSIEDGLGMHATNMNPLIGYEKTPPSSGHDHSLSHSYTSSQFTPRLVNENNLRRCITMNSQPGGTTVPVSGGIATTRQHPSHHRLSSITPSSYDQASYPISAATVMMRLVSKH